jgi:DNA-binding CsgD family transcriptional regulator
MYSREVARTRTDELVGRDEELALARRAMRDASDGHAATLLIEGEAGIGKTCFVHRLVDDALKAETMVLRGDAHPFETTRPFGALAAALDLRRSSPDPRRAAIGRMLVGDTRPSDPAAPTTPGLRFRVIEDIIDLIETICARRPILLVLEDLHWADNATLLAVRNIAHELPHIPLFLVASLRPSPRSAALDQLLDEVLVNGGRHIRLLPLPPAEVETLVRAELGVGPGPGLAAVIDKAGGNPLWVVEILRSLSAEGLLRREPTVADVTSPELPNSLRELVLRRLRYLPQPTLDFLQLAAVLGDAISISDLTAVARRPAADVLRVLGEAFRAQLLGEDGEAIVFRHQLVHDAIYQAIPRPLRSALHRDAAGALARAGAELSQVAGHLVLGASRGDLEAVRWLREAARDATAREPSVAVELLRCAQRLLPDGHPDADHVAAELVEAMLRAGQVAEAAELADAILGRPHRSDVDKPVRLWLLESLSLQNRGAELIAQAEAALAASPGLSAADQSLVLAQASYGRTFSGDFLGGEATARRALELAESAADVAMTVWSLTTMSVAVKTQGRYPEALAPTQRAVGLAFKPPNTAARLRHPHFFLGMALCDADRLGEARVAYRKAVEECNQLGSVWILPDTLLLSAELCFLLGEWDDATAELEAGLRVAHEHGHRISVPQSRAYQAVIAIARGDHQAAGATLATLEAELSSSAPSYGTEVVAFAAALLAETRGEATRAYELLTRFWRLDAQRENRYYHRYLGSPLVRLGLVLAERDTARRVAEEVEAGASLAPDVPTVQSAALRCRGLVEHDPDRMIRAVELARASLRFLDHTGACEDAARILAASGQIEQAKELWSEALERYEDVGARAWAMRATAALRRYGVRRGSRGPRQRPTSGWASLTPTERAVSELVAEGLTNREVGRRLYISPHTVNTHLRHVFQKLAVPTRAGLAAEVARQAELSR